MQCKTPVTQMVFFNQGMLIQGSNHSILFLNTTLSSQALPAYFLYLQPKHWNYPFIITFNPSLPSVSNIIIKKHFCLELRGKLYRYRKPQSSVWQHTSLLNLFISCDNLKQLFDIHLLWPSHAPPTLATFWLSSTSDTHTILMDELSSSCCFLFAVAQFVETFVLPVLTFPMDALTSLWIAN